MYTSTQHADPVPSDFYQLAENCWGNDRFTITVNNERQELSIEKENVSLDASSLVHWGTTEIYRGQVLPRELVRAIIDLNAQE